MMPYQHETAFQCQQAEVNTMTDRRQQWSFMAVDSAERCVDPCVVLDLAVCWTIDMKPTLPSVT